MINSVNSIVGSSPAPTAGRGMDSLGQGDFLRLLTVQMQQQDPFDPVDNKEMLAQMAQFSSLAGVADTNKALADISDKLDRLISAAEQNHTA